MDTVAAATIEDMIATGRIVEARTLLTMRENTLCAEELDAYTREIEQRLGRAEVLIAQAEALESAGNTEEAKALYESVLPFTADFPGLQEHIKRTDEALLLTRAVKRRSQRIRGSAPPKKRTKKRPLLFGAALIIALATAGLFLVPERPRPKPASLAETPLPPTPSPVVTPQSATPPPASAPVPQETAHTGRAAPPDPAPILKQPVSSPMEPAQPVSAPPEPPQEITSAAPVEIPATEGMHRPLPARAGQQRRDLYTVQPGDSLSLIAGRQLCHEPSWQKLYQLNQSRITDPRKLQPGTVLRLTGVENRCPPQ